MFTTLFQRELDLCLTEEKKGRIERTIRMMIVIITTQIVITIIIIIIIIIII